MSYRGWETPAKTKDKKIKDNAHREREIPTKIKDNAYRGRDNPTKIKDNAYGDGRLLLR